MNKLGKAVVIMGAVFWGIALVSMLAKGTLGY